MTRMALISAWANRCAARTRTIAYYLLWTYLWVIVSASAMTVIEYDTERETYHRVYSNAELVIIHNWISLVLFAVAIAFQARYWGSRRFSSIAVGIVLVDNAISSVTSEYVVVCCT